jgi:hypothetical protein
VAFRLGMIVFRKTVCSSSTKGTRYFANVWLLRELDAGAEGSRAPLRAQRT